MKENIELKKSLCDVMQLQRKGEKLELSGLMKDLYECAVKNVNRKKNGKTYVGFESLKEFGTILYLIGGAESYEIMAANTPFPSISTIKNIVHSQQLAVEGEFRIKGLKQYLEERGYPMKVAISEDGTRLVGKVLYHAKSNQVVGFVPRLDQNGVPVIKSFPATSANVITEYFENNEVSNYAYVLMAQPLVPKAPPYCLTIFGTNNKFNASHVLKRYTWMTAACMEVGIEVIVTSSDGDSRLMKAMRCLAIIPPSLTRKWPWFQASLKVDGVICFQDNVHLLVKLKTRLLKPSIILPMGPDYVASKGHLVEATKRYSKDLHEITSAFLDNKDKMNFRAADKLCSRKVIDFLRSSDIVDCEGTATYLEMMRDIFSSLADPTLRPLERVALIWEWVFFLRLLRQWIIDTKGEYILTKNFITLNAYFCVELNAHALIQLIVKLRESEECHLFLPWLMSSQPCESLFRLLRSLSSTFCTVVNFCLLEMLHKLRRLDFMSVAMHNLQDKYIFPRHMRAFEGISGQAYICTTLPEDYEIEECVSSAYSRAVARALRLKILSRPSKAKGIPPANLQVVKPDDDPNEDEQDSDDELDDDLVADSNDTTSMETQNDDNIEDVNMAEVQEDLVIASSGALNVKTFNDITITPTSPFLKVKDGLGSFHIMKKSTFIWLKSNGETRLSSDRLERVKAAVAAPNPSRSFTSDFESPVVQEIVSVGSWCAFVAEDSSLSLGRIMAFSYLSGSTWKKQEYKNDTAKVEDSGRPLACMCSWYKVNSKKILIKENMDVQGFYPLSNYICTLPQPSLTSKDQLQLPCSIQSIYDLSKGRLKKRRSS